MIIVGIDPGPDTSGLVTLAFRHGFPPDVRSIMREATLDDIKRAVMFSDVVVCEWLVSYGAAVGRAVLDTAKIIGRIEETAHLRSAQFHLITRPEVGLDLCQLRGAKRAQISEAIREIYRPFANGGGKNPVIGTKKKPGPLYGIALGNHEGSALAVALTWCRRQGNAI